MGLRAHLVVFCYWRFPKPDPLCVLHTSSVTILRTSYRPEPCDLFSPCYSEAAVFTLPFGYSSEVTDSIPAAIRRGEVRVSPEPTQLCCNQSKLPAPISY